MRFFPVLALFACSGDDPAKTEPIEPVPFGIPTDVGVTFAGAASVDITPVLTEAWHDDDGSGDYTAGDSFDDEDGDGVFDAVWIGGFGPQRPASGIHDPIYARALAIARDGELVVMVALDLVGLGHPRIWTARDNLVADGLNPEAFIVNSSHNHQGPDTMGLWGNPIVGLTGVDWAYQDQVAAAIEQASREAIAALEPADLTIGRVHMRHRSPWLNGADFGGKNPVNKVHGMVFDGRDPVVVSDQLLVLQANGEAGTIFTWTNWSGHPEVRGSDNHDISSDWVGVAREVIEAEFGGIAMHMPESLGGMQSALHADLPLILEDGTHLTQLCSADDIADPEHIDCFEAVEGSDRIDSDGDAVPVWAVQDSWEFVTSHGWLIGEAAIDALRDGEPLEPVPLRADREPYILPIENVAYNIFGPQGIFDMDIENAITDERCPAASSPDVIGCFEANTFRLQIGELGLVTVAGELLPELAWGFPTDDPRWSNENADPLKRGAAAGAVYFPQHPTECMDVVDYEECVDRLDIDDCDCRAIHAWPYTLSDDPETAPLLDALDTEYRAILGMTDSYFSYIIPEPDFNIEVSLFVEDGDHYEDTVSAAHDHATLLQEAQARISERW